MAQGWNMADVWETVASTRPTADCVVQGTRRISWHDFDRRAGRVAHHLVGRGLGHQAKVAFFVRNCPEFLIGVFAAFKAGLVPVNTNFRYRADEAARLWLDADAECVVFSGEFTDVVAAARPRVPGVTVWLRVDDGSGPGPDWATPFDAAGPVGGPTGWTRTPDDLILLYTGGTTGAPKGVMWRQDDAFAVLNGSAAVRYDPAEGLAGVAATQRRDDRPRPRFVPCGPLIHGTGGFSSYGVLGAGGTVVLLEGRRFEAEVLLDAVERERVTHVSIVGEAHGRPVADLLEAWPERWDLSSVRLVTSAGMALSGPTRARLLAHLPRAVCVDILGSSETPTIGRSRSTASAAVPPGRFAIGPDVRVFDQDDREVTPGSGQVGVLAVDGRGPLGYYKDPGRTAALFRTIGGRRWTITGDVASVHPDGTVQLLGRGATVINTGGEKVYAREVEDAILRNGSVADAVVVGLPDEVLGQTVVAAVQPRPADTVDPAALLAGLRATLAGYKVPKRVHVLDSVGRDERGKIDYPALVRRLTDEP